MPIAAISADDQAAAVAAADSDLKWLLSDNGVKIEVQAALFRAGFSKLKVFVGIGETRIESRDALRTDLGLDPADGVDSRSQVAMVLAAWDAARATLTHELKAKAEYKAAEIARPVPLQELSILRAAFEARWYVLDSRLVPSKSYLGTKQEEKLMKMNPVRSP